MPRSCVTCGQPCRASDRSYCSRQCWAAARERLLGENPPPGVIASRAAAIRAEWSEAERQKRLRVDWRPLWWSLRPVAVEAEAVLAE